MRNFTVYYIFFVVPLCKWTRRKRGRKEIKSEKKLHQSKYNLMIKSEGMKYKTDDEEIGRLTEWINSCGNEVIT